ncbi:hypothetical protein ERJ75_001138000 [Trypanosoma vivax]|nr:hypothetical protein ERJ75_001138000 [Trypanosoma vivax]
MQRVALSAMLACGLALVLASLPALANNGQGKALSEDKVQVVCKLSALLKKMSLEAKKMGSVATLATGFEASAAEEDMHVMREALGSAARLLRRRAERGKGTRNETQAREIAQRIVRLHEAEQQKALAAKLAENVRQRTALTAAAIDSWIKTFAGNFQGENEACIVAQGGRGNGKAQALRFNTEDRHAGGCAARAAAVKEKCCQAKRPDRIMNGTSSQRRKGSESDMLVGTETDTNSLSQQALQETTPEPPGSQTAVGLLLATHWKWNRKQRRLKWSDAHQDAGTDEQKSEDALNEMWLHFKQLKETHRQIINACNGQAKGAPAEAPEQQELCGAGNRHMRLAIAKKVMAADASTRRTGHSATLA